MKCILILANATTIKRYFKWLVFIIMHSLNALCIDNFFISTCHREIEIGFFKGIFSSLNNILLIKRHLSRADSFSMSVVWICCHHQNMVKLPNGKQIEWNCKSVSNGKYDIEICIHSRFKLLKTDRRNCGRYQFFVYELRFMPAKRRYHFQWFRFNVRLRSFYDQQTVYINYDCMWRTQIAIVSLFSYFARDHIDTRQH